MATIDTDDLFAKAKELSTERQDILERQKAVREVLRNLDAAGALSEEESALLEEIYPVRTRNVGGEDGELEGGGLEPEEGEEV